MLLLAFPETWENGKKVKAAEMGKPQRSGPPSDPDTLAFMIMRSLTIHLTFSEASWSGRGRVWVRFERILGHPTA